MPTIKIQPMTLRRLQMLKKRYNTTTYDALLNLLIKEKSPSTTMFGSCHGMKPWTKADRGDSKYD